MKPLSYFEVLSTPPPLSFQPPPLSVFHRLLLSLSLSSVCPSSGAFHPDQSGILSRLLWSLHHNYGAVGTGEIREWKKRKSGKKRQMKCRSVEMRSGQFLSLFLSVSLSPWATAKEAKRDQGESASHPHLPLSYLAQTGRGSDQVFSQKTTLMTDAGRWAWH